MTTAASLEYLAARTKFYRVGVFEVGHEFWVVFNWGAGSGEGDPNWMRGQAQVRGPYSNIHPAINVAYDKSKAKLSKPEYNRVDHPHNAWPQNIPRPLADHLAGRGQVFNMPVPDVDDEDPDPIPITPAKPSPTVIKATDSKGNLKPAFRRLRGRNR